MTLLFIHFIYNSLHLLIPNSQSIPPPHPSHLATTHLFSTQDCLFLKSACSVQCCVLSHCISPGLAGLPLGCIPPLMKALDANLKCISNASEPYGGQTTGRLSITWPLAKWRGLRRRLFWGHFSWAKCNSRKDSLLFLTNMGEINKQGALT